MLRFRLTTVFSLKNKKFFKIYSYIFYAYQTEPFGKFFLCLLFLDCVYFRNLQGVFVHAFNVRFSVPSVFPMTILWRQLEFRNPSCNERFCCWKYRMHEKSTTTPCKRRYLNRLRTPWKLQEKSFWKKISILMFFNIYNCTTTSSSTGEILVAFKILLYK